MAMREVNPIFSPCEVIRTINDKVQGEGIRDVEIRKLLYKLLKMNKQMSDEIHKYHPKYSFIWEEKTVNPNMKLENRIRKGYKVDK